MLFKYKIRLCQCSPCSTLSISYWKVAGAEVSLNGNTLHFHSPVLVGRPDFSCVSASEGTCGKHYSASRRLATSSRYKTYNFHLFLPTPLGSFKLCGPVKSVLFGEFLHLPVGKLPNRPGALFYLDAVSHKDSSFYISVSSAEHGLVPIEQLS